MIFIFWHSRIIYLQYIKFKVLSVAIFRPRGTTANTTKFEAWCMPSKATWRIYYTFYFVTWRRKNWENVDAKKMLKYSLLLKHYLLMNETWMTDFSWQTCLACQVLNVGYEKCKMLLRFQVYWFLYTFAKLLFVIHSDYTDIISDLIYLFKMVYHYELKHAVVISTQ